MYELKLQFSQDFERCYNEYKTKLVGIERTLKKEETDSDILSVQLKSGLLILNKSTGFVKLNDFEANINPESREFKVLLKLMSNKNHQATYKDLIGENPSKVNKRNFSFTIRNLKEMLGILPKKKAKNKDCIKNIKNYGYKLII